MLLCWRRGEEGGALLRLAGEDAKKRGLEASCDALVGRGVASGAASEGPDAGLLRFA